MKWSVANLSRHLVYGIVITLLIVFLRCGTTNASRELRALSTQVKFGMGPNYATLGHELDCNLNWQVRHSVGVTQCVSILMPNDIMYTRMGTGPTVNKRPTLLDTAPPSWSACSNPFVPPSNAAIMHTILEHAYGFPFRCLSERQDSALTPWERINGFELGVPFLQHYFGHDGIWPSRVYWPGMIGNALVFSSCSLLVSLLRNGARTRRMRRRITRGRCVHCNYDLTGNLETCPECGTPTLPRKQA